MQVWLGLLWVACSTPAPVEAPVPPPTEAPAPAPAAAAPARAPLPAGWMEQVLGADEDAELPMVVMIHGLGDRPESMLGLMSGLPGPVRVIAPAGPTPWGRGGHAWFTHRARDGATEALVDEMRSQADAFAAQLEAVVASRPTAGKPVIAGFSQGGMLSFAVAAHHPEVVARAVPVAGWLPPALVPAQAPAGAVPIVALHGEADPVLPLAPTQASVAGLKAAGFDVTLQTFPGVEHRIPPEVRNALYEAVATP